MRAAHVEVEYARDLLNAHRSGKTYGERLRRLILLRAEIAEIIEDLKASPGLFRGQSAMVDALEGIIGWLETGRAEYIARHDAVGADADAGKKLDATIRAVGMPWLDDFMRAGDGFRAHYEANLDRSKGRMRVQVFRR